MPAKTPVKKTARTKSPRIISPQTAKKAKRITQADIEVNFDRIQKFQDEAWAAIREFQQGVKDLMSAIASTITNEKTRNYALKRGLFVIEPSGEDTSNA